jgi:hypothetical protein
MSNSLATLNTAAAANVALQANVTLNAVGSHADLVARYSGPDEQNFYAGMVSNVGGVYKATIWRNTGGTYTQLGMFTLSTFTGSGVLRFELNGTSLKLLVDSVQVLAVMDSAFATGLVGMRSNNASLDNFNVS